VLSTQPARRRGARQGRRARRGAGRAEGAAKAEGAVRAEGAAKVEGAVRAEGAAKAEGAVRERLALSRLEPQPCFPPQRMFVSEGGAPFFVPCGGFERLMVSQVCMSRWEAQKVKDAVWTPWLAVRRRGAWAGHAYSTPAHPAGPARGCAASRERLRSPPLSRYLRVPAPLRLPRWHCASH
jgi:hypothetical protein